MNLIFTNIAGFIVIFLGTLNKSLFFFFYMLDNIEKYMNIVYNITIYMGFVYS
jgi:hypothetical protein